jgi:hypothetical protein
MPRAPSPVILTDGRAFLFFAKGEIMETLPFHRMIRERIAETYDSSITEGIEQLGKELRLQSAFATVTDSRLRAALYEKQCGHLSPTETVAVAKLLNLPWVNCVCLMSEHARELYRELIRERQHEL